VREPKNFNKSQENLVLFKSNVTGVTEIGMNLDKKILVGLV
jgi:hypothetical protein